MVWLVMSTLLIAALIWLVADRVARVERRVWDLEDRFAAVESEQRFVGRVDSLRQQGKG